MIKKYKIEYGFLVWDCIIEFNTTLFTLENVNEYLNFFSWSYNKLNDPYEEYAKKIAFKIIAESDILNKKGIINLFESEEGFPRLDGSSGVLLVSCDNWEFNEEEFEIEQI